MPAVNPEPALRDNQLELLWTARIDYAARSGVLRHRHDDHDQLLVVLDGEGEFELEERQTAVGSGSYLLVAEGNNHRFAFNQPSVTLDFKFKVHDQRLRTWLDTQPKHGSCSRHGLQELKHWFRTSLRVARDPSFLPPFVIDAGFKSSLAALLRQRETCLPRSIALEADFPMARYLEEHWQEPVSLDDLARRFRFHPHYIIELFQQHVGTTPIQYLQTIRLDKAKEWLEFTNLTVSEIAEQLGWSLPYFSRLFRAKEQTTPSDYREQTRTAVGKDILLNDEFQNQRLIIPL